MIQRDCMTDPIPHKYMCPCKGCTKRKLKCHAACPDYNDYRKKEAEYRKEYKQKNTDYGYYKTR